MKSLRGGKFPDNRGLSSMDSEGTKLRQEGHEDKGRSSEVEVLYYTSSSG